MITIKNRIKKGLLVYFVLILIFVSTSIKLFAEGIEWVEVSKSSNELVFIDPKSIKYNNNGFLSVITKYSEIDPEDEKIINTHSYLMAIDCENRLFSRLPLNAETKQVKNWETPIHDKLFKQTIINSCTY